MLPKSLKDVLLNILFPPLCLNCEKYLKGKEGILCAECLKSIKLNKTLFCPVCRARLPQNRKICHLNSLYLLAAASDYENPEVRNVIHSLKYRNFKKAGDFLGKILTDYLENIFINSDFNIKEFVLIPIPLHRVRERKRGFNQAKLLGESLSKFFGIQIIDGLKRVKNNQPQAEIKDYEKRIENIKGCFELKNSSDVYRKNILLIDDVFTSGATLNEAAKTLKEGGAKKIIALVVAKT